MVELSIIADQAVGEKPADAREPLMRLARLMDPGSLTPLQERDQVATVAARGRIDGEKVLAFCTDGTTKGGALGITECVRIAEAIHLAANERQPIIGLWHSAGAKLGDGIESMHGIGQIFAAMVAASGKIPQVSVVLGPVAGGAAYGAALSDIIIMAPAGRIFVTGPDVVRSVTGEQIDSERLGGAETHGRSGVAHVTTTTEADAYARARRLVGLLAAPGSFDEHSVTAPSNLRSLLPDTPRRAYDVRPLLRRIVDDDTENCLEELQEKWAPNIITALGRLGGGTLGIVANNPLRKAGCLDSASAEKAARFVRMCDAGGIPLLVVVDVPGYLPGANQEWGGVVRRGAKLLYAFAEATVPRVTLVTRKSYGGAYIAMNSRALGATAVYAWPEAEVAVMGAESAVKILHRRQLEAAEEHDRESLRTRLVDEHRLLVGSLDRAVRLGVIDAVIDPAYTRRCLAATFAAACAAASGHRGWHGNIPL
jgi:acetyl-CoA/propionyl-CoA carboxylase carboxyl transferase subunit